MSLSECWVWNTGWKRWKRDTSLSNIDCMSKYASPDYHRWTQHPHTDQQSRDASTGWKQQHQWKRWVWGTWCTPSGRSSYAKSASFRVSSSTTRWQLGGSVQSTDQETLTFYHLVENAKRLVTWEWIDSDMIAPKSVEVLASACDCSRFNKCTYKL